MELLNVSEVDVSYEIDINAMAYHLTGVSHGQNLFLIDNPKGTVSALSTVFIVWRFYPLEAVLYEFPLIIRYLPASNVRMHDKLQEKNNNPGLMLSIPPLLSRKSTGLIGGNTTAPTPLQISTQTYAAMGCITLQLTMRCPGYDPRVAFRPKVFPFGADFVGCFPPDSQLITTSVLEQPATVSSDTIDFGVVPIGSICSRMFILRNRLACAIEFNMEVPDDATVFNLLAITPSAGVIPANAHIVVNVRCISEGCPRIFKDRIKIRVREVYGDEVLTVSNTLFTKLHARIKTGRVSARHESVVLKSTATRRIQINDRLISEGRTASLPQPPSSAENDSGRSLSGGSEASMLSSLLTTPSDDHRGIRQTTSEVRGMSRSKASATQKMGILPASGSPSSRGSPKRTGTAEYGPACFLYIRIKGELHYWDTLANILMKGKAEGSLKEFLITPKVSNITQRIASPTPNSSPKDFSRSLSDHTVADRIKQAGKEQEMREVAEYIMADLFRTLLNPWDLGVQILDAVTTVAGGFKSPDSLLTPLVGSPVHGLFFDEVLSLDIEGKFLIELHHALGQTLSHSSKSSGYLSEVNKAIIPDYWIADRRAAFLNKRGQYVSRVQLFSALTSMGFSHKGIMFKCIDKMYNRSTYE
jgi:hypothetical protein